MSENKYDVLKLENQLCFPLYAVSKEIVRRYKPFLDEIDLTYTQYIVMMVLWDKGVVNVKELGSQLFLDSGTLTPVLKTLENKGVVTRQRSEKDERVLMVTVTESGMALRDRAVEVPAKIGGCVELEPEETLQLFTTLNKILDQFRD